MCIRDSLLVVAISGHGGQVIDPTGKEHLQFYFIPTTCDPNKHGEEERRKYCISEEEFSELAKLGCRRLFIVDTCHSGAIGKHLVDTKAKLRAWRNENIAIWCATQPAQGAEEYLKFTKRLVEAIKGNADDNDDDYVTLKETEAFIANRFKGQERIQKPQLYTIAPEFFTTDTPLLNLKLFRGSKSGSQASD